MVFEEKTMKSDKLYEGKLLNLRVDTVEIPDKKYSKREIVEHPGGVAVIPVTDDNSIILVKQYRKAVERFLLEVPAGKLELNEEPRETAVRELKEETGYEAKKLEYLLEFYTSPGFSNEKIYLFLATDLVEGEPTPDVGEFIETVKYNIEDLIKMVERGEITDSKTIIGINFAKKYIDKKQ
ncbi:NUDIX hydrolase [Tissierella carlieri]|jgi:ADP-ribose pyrophosphatase|uniref:NUDIX hydrolase n=1 Tax=Tissierella carlieri TaxID=689904 RepID=A0ABT1S5B3_9FIRM|nr:NUDIX hydrolase [Tissierella carlieri]MBU5311068.1 NUDIX hydrolase [Tissierella carlieri]MCQ4921661.1 NUDIX hydrolase [Tissierella carlieri]MDU5080005.1 NUDIX hydrolase [Bacillota bacterium]